MTASEKMKTSPNVLALESQVADLKRRLVIAENEIANLKRLNQRIERLEAFADVVMHEYPISTTYWQSATAPAQRRVDQDFLMNRPIAEKPAPKRRQSTEFTEPEPDKTAELIAGAFGLPKDIAMAVALGGDFSTAVSSKIENQQLAQRDAERTEVINRSKRFKFPCSLDRFLTHVLPKTKAVDRRPIYRRFLGDVLPVEGNKSKRPGQIASEEVVQKFLTDHRRGKCFTKEQLLGHARMFDRWLLTSKPGRLSERGKRAADGRWKKGRNKKI